MKLSGHVAVTAVVILVASAGVLSPLQSAISDVRDSVDELHAAVPRSANVQAELESLLDRIAEFEASVEQRTVGLCPNTPEAANAFEAALNAELRRSGLQRLSMDRRNGSPVGGVPTFNIELSVEGTASQVHDLLGGLESLRWLSRVMQLNVAKGRSVRTVDLSIAVLLETDA